MDASRDQMDRVDRYRLVESGGARNDSLVTQSEWTARVHGFESRCASVGASIVAT